MDDVREDTAVVEVTVGGCGRKDRMKMENPLCRPFPGESDRRRKERSHGSLCTLCVQLHNYKYYRTVILMYTLLWATLAQLTVPNDVGGLESFAFKALFQR